MSKYFWFEFVEHLEERISSIENEIASLMVHLEHLGRRREALIYYDELKLILETIGKSYDDLAMINRDLRLEAEVLPQLRFLLAGAQNLKNSLNEDIERLLEEDDTPEDFFYKLRNDFSVINNLIDNLERALTYLKYGIDQASGGEFLKQSVQYQYSFTGPLTDIPSWEKTLKAVSAVVHNYSELIFGRGWLKEHKIRPIAVAGFEDYSIMPPIYIAHYPIVDTFRTRFWAAFGHEIQHEKNHILLMFYLYFRTIVKDENIDEIIEKQLLELPKRKIKLLSGEISKYSERWEKWFELQSKLESMLEMQNGISLYKLLDEIVCDLSGTLLTSLPGVLSLISRYSPGIYDLNYYRHPPTYLRFEYCLKAVKDVLKLKKFVNEYSEILKKINEEFDDYIKINKDLELSNFQKFRHFIKKNFKKLVDLTKLSITSYILKGDEILFSKKQYKQAVEVKDGLSESKHLTNISENLTGEKYGIEPRVLITAGWLRRLDEFKELENQPSNLFIEFRKYRGRFYPKIVLYLHQYYENKCRRW